MCGFLFDGLVPFLCVSAHKWHPPRVGCATVRVVIVDNGIVSSEKVYDRLLAMGFLEPQCEDAAMQHPLDFELALEYILRTSDSGGAHAWYGLRVQWLCAYSALIVCFLLFFFYNLYFLLFLQCSAPSRV